MKAILVDYSNEGILYVTSDPTVANLLKKGLIDTSVRLVWPWHACYNDITQSRISGGEHWWISTQFQLNKLSLDACNDVYMERLRLVGLRSRLMEALLVHVKHAARFTHLSPWSGFENSLDLAIRDSDPDSDTWSNGVRYYSDICNIEPRFAYREIGMMLSHVNDTKLRLFAHLMNYSNKINQVTSSSERDSMNEEMLNTFMRDTMV